MDKVEKVRFAPSPTGYLHIGGARTALFNYLYAKSVGGKFLLRIEDTDLARSSKESEDVIIRDLHWLGIGWDEGIEIGGESGPYRSMERMDIYKPYIDQLLKEGKAYYCYCSSEEVEAMREEQRKNNELPRYTGKCRELSKEEKEQYEKEGRQPVIRFRVPEDETIVVRDAVRGDVEFDSNGVGDFIIVKSDGTPVYNFAVTVDDYLMGITTVIRGEEHLSNTPRQLLLYQALGFDIPKFAHVSLILGEDRSKMSKRHGSTHVDQYTSKGYLPEAVVNFLALMGWSPENEEEFYTLEELEKQFSLERVTKNPAVFDIKKLNWMNGQYIRKADIDRITRLAIPYLVDAGYFTEEEGKTNVEWVKKIVEATREKIDYLAQITDHVDILFAEQIELENDEAREMMAMEHIPLLLNTLKKKIEAVEVIDEEFAKGILKEIQKETKIRGKNLFMGTRVSLTGQCHGPDLVKIIEILGKGKIVERIDYALHNMIQ